MAKVMPRVMEIATPLGEGVLLFHRMNAREEMSRLFEYHLDLLSPKEDINLDEILGKNVTIKLGLADDETRFFNGYVTRFAAGRHARPLSPLHRDGSSLALVPDAHVGLPHLPGDDRPGDHQESVCRSRGGGLQVRAHQHLPEVDVLRPVPGDRLQLRQPADGAGGHRLLLPAQRGAQHAGAHRFDEQTYGPARAARRCPTFRPSRWSGRSSST